MAQSSNITNAITVSQAIADAVRRMRGEATAVVQPDGTLVGDFSGFVFADNPANNLAEHLYIDDTLHKGCGLNSDGSVSVPNANLTPGASVEVVEGGPFYYEGIPKDLNMSELAYPAIIYPRPQRETLYFGSAASATTRTSVTLMFVDYAEHNNWTQPTIGPTLGDYSNNFERYIELPQAAQVRRFLDAIAWTQIQVGGKTATITISEGKTEPVGELMFVPKFGSDAMLSELGFDENLSGYVLNIELTIHNSACLP